MTDVGRINRREEIRTKARQLARSIRVYARNGKEIRVTAEASRRVLEKAFDYLLTSGEPYHVRRIGPKALAGFPTHRTSAPDGSAYLGVCLLNPDRGVYILSWDDAPGFSLADQHAANRAFAEETIVKVAMHRLSDTLSWP